MTALNKLLKELSTPEELNLKPLANALIWFPSSALVPPISRPNPVKNIKDAMIAVEIHLPMPTAE